MNRYPLPMVPTLTMLDYAFLYDGWCPRCLCLLRENEYACSVCGFDAGDMLEPMEE